MRNTLLGLAAAALVSTAAAAEPQFPEVPPAREVGATAALYDTRDCTFEIDGAPRPALCGTLLVPENRKIQGSRLIALPVIRILAERPGSGLPLFWFEGGPGQPNLLTYPGDGLLARHDIVLVGYRGVDSDVTLDCPEISRAVAGAPGRLLDEVTANAHADSARACAERLGNEGVDLDGYSMVETVDDFEAARVALGYRKIILFGNSYGTRLQQIFMWRHPDAVARVVMVGVNPPGHFIWDPATTQALLDRYFRLCSEDERCAARTADLSATMRDLRANAPDSYFGLPIDMDVVRLLTLYNLMESVAPEGSPVPFYAGGGIDLWLDAAEGDFAGMVLATLLRRVMLPTSFNSWGHFLAMGTSTDDYYGPRAAFALEPGGTVLGAPASRFLAGFVAGWPKGPDAALYNTPRTSDIEVLLVSGSVDFSTPPEAATRDLLPFLPNGRQVILKEMGHAESFWHSQPEARARLLHAFFDEGKVDASGYVDQKVVLDPGLGWSELAWWLLGIAAAALALVAASAALILRWFLRRRRAAAGRP